MKKLYLPVALSILLLCGIASFAQERQVKDPQQETAIPTISIISRSIILTGSLDKTTSPIYLKAGQVQELQNMRRPNPGVPLAGWEPRSGTTLFNTTAVAAAQVKSLFHHVNADLSVDAFYAQVNDALYLSSVSPPNTTATFGTSKYSLTSGAQPLFGESVGDDLIMVGSGTSPCANSGTSAYPDGFYISRSGSTEYDSGYDYVRDNRTDTTIIAFQSTSDAMYVGFRRRLEGVYFELGSVNSAASGLTVYARRSGAWSQLTITDGTASGVSTFAQSGTVTWTASALDQHYVLENTHDDLFWYKFTTGGDVTDGITIRRVIVLDRTEEITSLWSGMYDLALGALLSTTTGFINYTPEVTDGTKYEYADLSSMATTQYFYVGFAFKTFGIYMDIVSGAENSGTSCYPTVQAWNGATGAWTSVGTVTDGTRNGNYSLNHTGLIQWDGNSVTETKRTLGGILTPLYWYRIYWSATLPSSLHVGEIGQSTKPESIPPMPQYEFVIEMAGRAMYGPGNINKHGLDFSYPNLPHVMTGPLAGSTGNIFGPGRPNAAARLYMNAVVSTKNPYRTYLLEGKGPGKWDELLLSDTVGAVAPHSMVYVTDALRLFSQDRSVHGVFFLSHDGVYATDGQTLICVSHPVSKYWDTSAGPYIEPAYAKDSYAWVDYREKTIHFAVPVNTAGTGTQTTLNRELVYNYITNEWYDVYKRASPLSCGKFIVTFDGQKLTYGGDYSGYVHKLNTGTTDNTTAIDYYLITGDIQPLEGKADAFNFITQLRSMKLKGESGTTGTVRIDVYPDGKTTPVMSSNGQISMVNSGYKYYSDKVTFRDSVRGESFSFKIGSAGEVGANGNFLGFTLDAVPIRETY